MRFSKLLEELKKLDKKYIMVASYYTSGKLECYSITTRETYKEVHEKLKTSIERDSIFPSLEEGLKHAGENCNKVIFPSIDKCDGEIINKAYKKFGGYVTLFF